MLTIEMLGAQQGDALFIEYGDPKKPRRIVVDAGVKKKPNVVRDRIAQLPEKDRTFELLVITHVDADHILGCIPLLQDEKLGATFKDVWFNGWKHLDKDMVEPMGPVDGEELTWLLRDRAWNKAFKARAVAVPEKGKLPSRKLPGGLRVTIVGPTSAELLNLVPEWEKVVKKAGLKPGTGRAPTPPEHDSDIEGLGPPGAPDVEALAKASFQSDQAEANGSSIVLLLEDDDGRSALLCGDAWPSTVRAGVTRLLAERGGKRLKVGAFKPPHHGSKKNLDLELAKIVDARDFLFSSNGTKTEHPHREAVARVLHTAHKPRLWFNYKTKHNEVWDGPSLKTKHGYTATYGDGRVSVPVDPR